MFAHHAVRQIVLVGVLGLVLGACASVPKYTNDPLDFTKTTTPDTRTHVFGTKKGPCRDDSIPWRPCASRDTIFVGIAISGGGSRAANYAAAVMKELDRLGMMQHVDAISAVSGGALAAAYYVLHSSELSNPAQKAEAWEKAKTDLTQSFRSRGMTKLMAPTNLAATFLGHTGRTELLAQVFEEALFPNTTFGTLPKSGPNLIINATAINQPNYNYIQFCSNREHFANKVQWESVSFKDTFFNHCLNSRLDTYPVAAAVAASAAFPGALSAMPLIQWESPGPGKPLVKNGYLHVVDGGPSDNLGVDGLLGEMAANVDMGHGGPDRCLVIVIDAFADAGNDDRVLNRDVRGVVGRLIDPNYKDSFDALLARRRFDTLQRLGVAVSLAPESEPVFVDGFPVPGHKYTLFEQSRVAKDITLERALGRFPREPPPSRSYGDGRVETIRQPQCMVWHIAANNLPSTILNDWKYSHAMTAPFFDYKAELLRLANAPQGRHTVEFAEVFNRVKTDFRLTGPKGCSSEQVGSALWEAGRLSVAGDRTSRRKVCAWFADSGLPVAADCADPVDVLRDAIEVPIRILPPANPAHHSFQVECGK